ncbi:glycosyltransferase [Brachymonas chironomi]|uniref:capsular polysaccharide export protein, LipB/KpsS family n=1 Tax=Brachymonas chironomi TaxID=491919 RepID=UPI00096DA18C|nr:glycosyltransferase [Brachymonas chironomi]
MKKISSIIPLRTDDFSFYLERLILRTQMDLSQVETVIIDDGSPLSVSYEIQEFCKENKFLYKRLDTAGEIFSLSRARNSGISAASCEWIVMEDADIVYTKDFYSKIAVEVDLIDRTPFNFLTIPVIYLKEEISKRVFDRGVIDPFVPEILTAFQFEDPRGGDANIVVESYSPATALFVARKKLFNLVGGYDEGFYGWGGEDRDIAFRMSVFNDDKKSIYPRQFDVTKSWNLNKTIDYEGWRSLYRLTGDYLTLKGLYGFHLYHPKLEWRERVDTKKNIEYAKAKAVEAYKSKKIFPNYDADKPVNVIIGNNPYLINGYVLGQLDNVCILDDNRRIPFEDTLALIQNMKHVSAVYFWNSYGTEWKLKLYRALQSCGYKTVVVERGALPESYYFDVGGFCIESDSYQKFDNISYENEENYHERKQQVDSFIEELRYGNKALEAQADRLLPSHLRLKLGLINKKKKILFCPLQLSTDTVTTYYIDGERTYTAFLEEIRKLESMLPKDWVLVVKNHPLAVEQYESPGVIIADDCHINDLLEVASAVVLFNSGCGVISMAFDKPVFYYGKCFYAIEGVNEFFRDAEYLKNRLSSGEVSVDADKVHQFFYFLLHHFYSFATVENEVVTVAGVKKNILKSIEYSSIKLPDQGRKYFPVSYALSDNSILLDRYAKSLYLARRQQLEKKTVPVKSDVQAKAKGQTLSTDVSSALTSDAAAEQVMDVKKTGQKLSTYQYYEPTWFLRPYTYMVAPFMSKKKREKLKKTPGKFFDDSKSSINNFFAKYMFRERGRK